MRNTYSNTRFVTHAYKATGASAFFAQYRSPSFHRVTKEGQVTPACAVEGLHGRSPEIMKQVFYDIWIVFWPWAARGDVFLDTEQACLLLWMEGLSLIPVSVSKTALCPRGKCYEFQVFCLYKRSWKDLPEQRVVGVSLTSETYFKKCMKNYPQE